MKNLINQPVGLIRVSKPIEYCDRSFECAAWSETRLSTTGVFVVYLRQDFYNKSRFYFSAAIPATVKSDFFPALFCGVGTGKPYDTTANAGNKCRDVIIVKEIVLAIRDTNNSDDDADGCKWAIAPEHYQAICDHYATRIIEDGKRVADYLANFASVASGGLPVGFLSSKGIGEAAGSLKWAGDQLAYACDAVEKIDRAIRYQAGSFAKYYHGNNPFVPDDSLTPRLDPREAYPEPSLDALIDSGENLEQIANSAAEADL